MRQSVRDRVRAIGCHATFIDRARKVYIRVVPIKYTIRRKAPARNVIPGHRAQDCSGDAADERDGGHGRAHPARAVGARETSFVACT